MLQNVLNGDIDHSNRNVDGVPEDKKNKMEKARVSCLAASYQIRTERFYGSARVSIISMFNVSNIISRPYCEV